MAGVPILQPPYQNEVVDNKRLLTTPWQQFFSLLKRILDPLGVEKSFDLANNQASASDIEGLRLNADMTRQAFLDYFIQRITTGGGATELVETGTALFIFKAGSVAWELVSGGPSTSGVTLSVTTAGKVQYATTNITGTPDTSKISYRLRSMVG